MEVNSLFGKHQITNGNSKLFNFGKLTIGAKREKEGWFLLTQEGETDEKKQFPELTEGDFYQTGKSNSLLILPATPSKPLVFKGSKMFVTPKQKLTFFIKIPLSIQVYFSKNQPENLLREIPGTRLSDTWFGDPDSGEPAFALGSDFYLNLENIDISALEAVCPVSIFNNSSGILEVERLIIRSDNLALYKNERIISSVVEIEYKGKDTVSSAEYHYSKIFHGEKPEVITKPRSSGKSLLKMNFHFIKNIYKSE